MGVRRQPMPMRQQPAIPGWLVIMAVLLWLWSCPFTPVWAADFTKEDLQGRNFAGQDLRDSSFVKANLRQSDLNHVQAAGVNLFGANLSHANLQAANLTGATLDMANLAGADLRGAILENSLMWLAKVEDAQIEGADFTDALIRQDGLNILCKYASGTNPVTGRDTRESLGC
ncbi:MAG: pentapeptide repeat-containing protein [Cyanobacteriota bacterium]|nr:pentapeptide repeat-containing protein [Cyanobacteriota bacterium]